MKRIAYSLLYVAFIVRIARGVSVILNDGNVCDFILFYSAKRIGGLSPALFILLLLAIYFLFGIFINSSSGTAVLTMPIIGAQAIEVNIPGRKVINAYQYGMNTEGLIALTVMVLSSLELLNISYKAWLKLILSLLYIIFTVRG
ncbi:MAG: hypothetical protein ABI415_00545 [Flavitalea sp.]